MPACGLCGITGLFKGRRHLVDALDLARSTGVHDIRLQDVDIAEQHQVLEPPPKRILFAGGHGNVQRVADLFQTRQVVMRYRFLEVVDAERLETSALLDRRGHRIAVIGVESPSTRRRSRTPAPF